MWKYAVVVILVVAAVFSIKLLKEGNHEVEKSSDSDQSAATNTTPMLTLTSSAFKQNETIPAKYTCDGVNENPPLTFQNVPENTVSLAIIMYDPDIPESVKQSRGIDRFDHWVAFNMLSTTRIIEEGKDAPGTLGGNGAGKKGYTGPCPPDKEHRYFFELYALDTMLTTNTGATRQEVEKAIEGHIIEKAELIGYYDRPR